MKLVLIRLECDPNYEDESRRRFDSLLSVLSQLGTPVWPESEDGYQAFLIDDDQLLVAMSQAEAVRKHSPLLVFSLSGEEVSRIQEGTQRPELDRWAVRIPVEQDGVPKPQEAG